MRFARKSAVVVSAAVLLLGSGVLLADTLQRTVNDGTNTRTLVGVSDPTNVKHNSGAEKSIVESMKSTASEYGYWRHPKFPRADWKAQLNANNTSFSVIGPSKKHIKTDKSAYGSFNAQDSVTLPLANIPGNIYVYLPSHAFKNFGTPPDTPDRFLKLGDISNSLLTGDPDTDAETIQTSGTVRVEARASVEQVGGNWVYRWKVTNNTSTAYNFNWPSARASDVFGWSGSVDANSELTLERSSSALPAYNTGSVAFTASGESLPRYLGCAIGYYPSNLTAPVAVSGLSGSVNGNTVTLNWTNNGTYDKILVYLEDSTGLEDDGEIVEELSGSATTVAHVTERTGNLTYTVYAEKDWISSAEAATTVSK